MEKGWKLNHVGVVVRDMDKAVEYYQSLGIARFQPEHIGSHKSWTDFMVYGKPADPEAEVKTRWVQIGSVTLELLQPVEGETPWKEFLDSNGEGIQHIALIVDDLDKETAKMVEKGVSVIHSAGIGSTRRWAYFDTRKIGNVILELGQRNENMVNR